MWVRRESATPERGTTRCVEAARADRWETPIRRAWSPPVVAAAWKLTAATDVKQSRLSDRNAVRGILMLARSNYEVQFQPQTPPVSVASRSRSFSLS